VEQVIAPALEFFMHKGLHAPQLRRDHWEWKETPSWTVVGCLAGVLAAPVSCVRLFSRRLTSPGGQCFNAYGVGGVFTIEAWRGKGLAGRVLSETAELARDRGAAALALFAVYGRALYLRAGYVPVRQANDAEHLWVKILDPGLAPLPGDWRLWPDGHF
jgi:GNAT superfamily N-acetyltransferase